MLEGYYDAVAENVAVIWDIIETIIVSLLFQGVTWRCELNSALTWCSSLEKAVVMFGFQPWDVAGQQRLDEHSKCHGAIDASQKRAAWLIVMVVNSWSVSPGFYWKSWSVGRAADAFHQWWFGKWTGTSTAGMERCQFNGCWRETSNTTALLLLGIFWINELYERL